MIVFLYIWFIVVVWAASIIILAMGVIAFMEIPSPEPASIRKRLSWLIGILFWPISLTFLIVIGVLAAFGFRVPQVTQFREWLAD